MSRYIAYLFKRKEVNIERDLMMFCSNVIVEEKGFKIKSFCYNLRNRGGSIYKTSYLYREN